MMMRPSCSYACALAREFYTHSKFIQVMGVVDVFQKSRGVPNAVLSGCILSGTDVDFLRRKKIDRDIIDLVDRYNFVFCYNQRSLRSVLDDEQLDHDILTLNLARQVEIMRSPTRLSKVEQARQSLDALYIHTAIADWMGMENVSVELSSRAMLNLFSAQFFDICLSVNSLEPYWVTTKDVIGKHIHEICCEATVEYRVKTPFSIFKKMKNQSVCIESIFDVFGMRVILTDVYECYLLLHSLHTTFAHMMFKDFIHSPKKNNYQSLHTVIRLHGMCVEIQIRTREMDESARVGESSHWKYKHPHMVPVLTRI